MAILGSSKRRPAGRCANALACIACFGASACVPQDGSPGSESEGQTASLGLLSTYGVDREGIIEGNGRYPLTAAPSTWAERQIISASDGGMDDRFGQSVALDGDTALVGAPSDDDAGADSGAAYVFVRNAANWVEQKKLLASDGAASAYFGERVALSGDTALVGAKGDDLAGVNTGAAYVFVRSASTWSEQQKLIAGDRAALDLFGVSVAVSADTALVGASGNDDKGNGSGSVYAFVRSASSWVAQQKLLASDGAAYDSFGRNVALEGDTALAGAMGDDDKGDYSGSAYVFTRDNGTWTEQAKLVASDGAQDDYFGKRVALSGEAALVGADGDDDNGAASGSAYVFVRDALAWTQQDKLLASDGAATDLFGGAVALSGDTALVGAHSDTVGSGVSGSAYVFVRNAISWVEGQKLSASDRSTLGYFGSGVSLSGDTALVGAWASAVGGNSSAGVAYLIALRLVDGQPCMDGVACASKFCVDGVCCNDACEGSCEACNVAGLEGSCAAAPRGDVPAPSCNGYLCNGAVGGCPDDCAGTEDCASEYHCPTSGACVPRAVPGEACSHGDSCASGHCIDGICCDQTCDDGCGSCTVAGLEGACTPTDKGQPGTPSCAPYRCGGSGTACPSACGANGDCVDGHHCEDGTCRPDGIQGAACSDNDVCTTGHCTDGTCCVAESCGAYRCGAAGACMEACSSSAQCAGGHECTSAGKCEPQAASSDAADESGSCHVVSSAAGGHRSVRWPAALGWLACLGLARRRRRLT